MAIKASLETTFGEQRELYVRLNNAEVNNHGAECTALFRGYLSRDAFECGKSFVFEKEITFIPDVSRSIWEQAYTVIKGDLSNTQDV